MILEPQDRARYARQVMLADIGEVGQAAIVAATARVHGELGACYARCAGFAATVPGSSDRDRWAPRDMVAHESARDVLCAAREVLAEIRRVLGGVR